MDFGKKYGSKKSNNKILASEMPVILRMRNKNRFIQKQN
jgi:hypothetical protein